MAGAGAGRCGGGGHRTVPLAVLLQRDLTREKIGRPDVVYGQANQSRKGEDFTFVKTDCQRVPGDGASTFSVFAVMEVVSKQK